MKKLLILICLSTLVVACSAIKPGLRGSGNIQKERREVATFDSISAEGAFEVEVVGQKPQSLEIEGDDNLLPLIVTEVSNSVLHIRSRRSLSATKPIVLRISVSDLRRLHASGASTMEVTGLKNDEFKIETNGASTIRASGETKSFNLDANGAGSIDTHKLRARNVVIDSKGVSNIDVYAGEQLDVTVSGPSVVFYRGNPKVRQTVNGPGSVQKRETEGS